MDAGEDIDELVALAQKRKSSTDISETTSKKKSKKNKANQEVSKSGASTEADSTYPYPVTADDHCESPLEAYRDISSFLLALCGQLGKTPATLAIFDPYYCEGSMKGRLRALGFENVHNEKKDFYELIRTNTLPEFDVLVTNPPYSADHMERLLRFCTGEQCRKPWFLLVPNYVYTKDYYASIFGSGEGQGKQQHCAAKPGKGAPAATTSIAAVRSPFYVTPEGNRRYLYTTPKGRRQEKSAKFTSPFPTFWYCQVYEHREKLLSQAAAIRVKAAGAEATATTGGAGAGAPNSGSGSSSSNTGIVVAISSQAIPLQHAPDNDPRKKRLRNNKKRSKNKQRQKTDKA